MKARIFVGHYEARVSPIADTDPATNAPATTPPSANNLDATANFTPGTYEFIATAPGYGAVRFRRTFTADTPARLAIRFAPNWASKGQGAKASGTATAVKSADGSTLRSNQQVLDQLIDDTEATDWQAGAEVRQLLRRSRGATWWSISAVPPRIRSTACRCRRSSGRSSTRPRAT